MTVSDDSTGMVIWALLVKLSGGYSDGCPYPGVALDSGLDDHGLSLYPPEYEPSLLHGDDEATLLGADTELPPYAAVWLAPLSLLSSQSLTPLLLVDEA